MVKSEGNWRAICSLASGFWAAGFLVLAYTLITSGPTGLASFPTLCDLAPQFILSASGTNSMSDHRKEAKSEPQFFEVLRNTLLIDIKKEKMACGQMHDKM